LDSKSGLPIVKEMDVQKEPVVSDSDETDDEDGPGELHAIFDLIEMLTISYSYSQGHCNQTQE
jgi:hypothetical protein